MSLARLIVPPIAGATTSLALLYLYHQATLSRHEALQCAIGQTRESIEDAEHKIRDKFGGRPSTSAGTNEGEKGPSSHESWGGRSRYQEKRYKSIAEEVKDRWNYHLLHLPSTLSHLEPDNIILTTLATITNFARAGISAISNTANSSSSSEAKDIMKEKTGDLADKLKEFSLRSEEEIRRKIEEVGEGADTQEARRR